MKTNLLLLAGLLIAVAPGESTATSVFADQEGFVIAKAVKLGRGNAYSVAADPEINIGQPDVELKKGECEINEECPSDKKCMNNKCVDVCTQPTGNGISYAKICGGLNCILDPNTPHAFKCVDACYNVVCKSGYTTQESSTNTCCCVPSSCPSGQRLENGKCVANCSGVVCKSGYKAVSNATGCCCEADTSSCSAGQIYNTTIGKCVSAVCPLGCLDDCKQGCGSCESGRYLNYNDGLCPLCSSAIANCATCTSSKSGPTCTKCKSGYLLSSGKCVSCPANATCSGTVSFTCKSGYEKYNDTCRISSCDGINSTPRWCQDGYTRVEGKGCCPPGVDANRVGACYLCRTTSAPVISNTCANGLQNCGDTGCCPTGNSCSYYAQKAAAGIAMCVKTNYSADIAPTF